MKSTSPFLSIIIPARQEAQRLPKTIQHLQDFFQYRSWLNALPHQAFQPPSHDQHETFELEIIPVIQGNDETSSLVCELAKKDPRIKPIIDLQGRGKGRAVRYGVEQAQGAIILFIDADLSVPPHCIAQLLRQFQSSPSCDILIGSRQLPQSNITRAPSWYRRFLSRVFNLFLRSMRFTNFRDTQCGCKLFRHDVAKTLFSYATVNGFAFDVEILLLAKNIGYHVEEAPVEWGDGDYSRFGISSDGIQALEDVWNLTEYR